MSETLAGIHNDHRHYNSLLDLLNSDIEKLQHSDDPDFIRLYDIISYMSNYPDISHHPVEDIIFRKLEEKAPETTRQVDKLQQEHRELARLGQTLGEKLHYVTSGSIISRDTIITAAREYCQLLASHVNNEEGQILPLVENTFTHEDWAEVDAQIDKVEDPLFGDVVQEQFADLYKRITLAKDALK